jgi:hypothetical protein
VSWHQQWVRWGPCRHSLSLAGYALKVAEKAPQSEEGVIATVLCPVATGKS